MTKHEAELPQDLGKPFFEHMNNPRNVGTLTGPDGESRMVGLCGDVVTVRIRVNGDRIKKIRVIPEGCAYTLVCASAMSGLAEGRSLDEALALEPEEVAEVLGGLPEDHMHCARLAVNALGEAVAEYYRLQRRDAEKEIKHAHL
jgi:nitrogen fixation NifU-like protein